MLAMQTLKSNFKKIFLKCIKKLSITHIYVYTHMVVENYTKDLKESVCQGAVVSALAIDFTISRKV